MSKPKKQIRHKAGAHTFFLKPLSKGMFVDMLGESSKPQPPMVEVQYFGGETRLEPNPNDPGYLQQLQLWDAQYAGRLLRLCITQGIERVENGKGGEALPTTDEIDELRYVYGPVSMKEILRHWYAKLLGDTSDGFINLVLGQTEVTEEGLEEAEEKFRSGDSGSRRGDPDENHEAAD